MQLLPQTSAISSTTSDDITDGNFWNELLKISLIIKSGTKVNGINLGSTSLDLSIAFFVAASVKVRRVL